MNKRKEKTPLLLKQYPQADCWQSSRSLNMSPFSIPSVLTHLRPLNRPNVPVAIGNRNDFYKQQTPSGKCGFFRLTGFWNLFIMYTENIPNEFLVKDIKHGCLASLLKRGYRAESWVNHFFPLSTELFFPCCLANFRKIFFFPKKKMLVLKDEKVSLTALKITF